MCVSYQDKIKKDSGFAGDGTWTFKSTHKPVSAWLSQTVRSKLSEDMQGWGYNSVVTGLAWHVQSPGSIPSTT